MGKRAIYATAGAEQTEAFFDSLHAEATKGGKVFDTAADVSQAALDSARNEAGFEVPASVQKVMAELKDDDQRVVLDSVIKGMEVYKQYHGELPTADVIDAALHQGYAASLDPKRLFDSVGSSSHSDSTSAQPNRAVIAITAAIAEAFPAATYLPADIGSNEAKLAIVSHLAGSNFGDYAQNSIMDGISVGGAYISSERRITVSINGGGKTAALTGQFTTTTGGANPVELLRYRTKVFVNGFPCAFESTNTPSSAATNTISGVATISGTDYTITGTVTPATGAVSISTSADLPANTVVEVEGYIDYEKQPMLSPEIVSQVTTFSLFATAWRARARQTIDSKTQYANELGLDLASEALIAIRNQSAMERHYSVLKKAKVLASNNTHLYDFALSTQIGEKTRAQIWQDFQAVLGIADQQMAEDTMDHGITHLYVTKNVAAQWISLPRDIWEPSGIVARPGIFRLGRLFGRYEVYYTPKVLTETSTGSQILCFGRSTQVARNPFVLGDAVPATFLPLAFGDDMKSGSGYYARNFTEVNPHKPSALGVALINVVNLF